MAILIEDLLAERDISVSYKAIRLLCNKSGPQFARRLRRKHLGFGDTFYVDGEFVKVQGKQVYLWRAVNQDGKFDDVFLQKRRDGKSAKRFFGRFLKKYQSEPRIIRTDKLRSYAVAHGELIPDAIHNTNQYANNRAELSQQPARVRERGMRKFKSREQGQRFMDVQASVCNLFNLGRHLVSAKTYKLFRLRAFVSWEKAAAI